MVWIAAPSMDTAQHADSRSEVHTAGRRICFGEGCLDIQAQESALESECPGVMEVVTLRAPGESLKDHTKTTSSAGQAKTLRGKHAPVERGVERTERPTQQSAGGQGQTLLAV